MNGAGAKARPMARIAAMWRRAMLALADLRVRPWHLLVLALLAVAGEIAHNFEWLLATFIPKLWAEGALGALAWCGVAAEIVLAGLAVFVVTTLGRERLAALMAMWRPLVIVLLAAYLLFFNDQCKELGVSLMIGDGDWWRAFFLLFVLVFWALNNWHSARLGLWLATKQGRVGSPPIQAAGAPARNVTSADTPWIFWGPRLLGVCAHLLAAASLALAALKQPEFGSGPIRYPAAASAVVIIVLVTLWVYRFDRGALSQRDAGPDGAAAALDLRAWEIAKFVLRKSWRFLLVASTSLLVAAAFAYLAIPQAPPGFVVGTLAISESAVVYLTAISAIYHRKPLGRDADPALRSADDAREERNFKRWTVALFIFCIPFIVWTLIDAPSVGRAFGSMVIALFTFGALLATVNGLELTTAWAGQRLFGERARPHVFHAYATAGLVALCVFNAGLHPFHAVRPCQGDDCAAPNERLDVRSATELWYSQAQPAYAHSGGGDKVPMLIVATAGGGIRAAYWTARVLDKLEEDMAASGGARPYIFAISGVSGGSVGATAFSAALAERDQKNCQTPAEKCARATSFLKDDYFAPTLASWIFKDTLASLWPWPLEDRAAALEQSFEHASHGLMAASFLGLFNRDAAFDFTVSRSTWKPILLLNATHEETGKRVIASQVKVERDVFVDAFDELDVLKGDLRASTAAINSARFTYVSPAGFLGAGRGSLIDGGYYENYGALTALELARSAELALAGKVKVVILMITSDPTLGKTVGDPNLDKSATLVRIDQTGDANPCVVSATEHDPKRWNGPNYLPDEDQPRANPWLNEFVAPLQGITTVREAHGNRAAAELAVQTCAEYPKTTPTIAGDQSAGASASGASSQTKIAQTLKVGKETLSSLTEPAKARPGLPYFAHVGMCQFDRYGEIPVTPPLGWVLSQATRIGLDKLVDRCGNKEQLDQLEHALKPPPATADKTP